MERLYLQVLQNIQPVMLQQPRQWKFVTLITEQMVTPFCEQIKTVTSKNFNQLDNIVSNRVFFLSLIYEKNVLFASVVWNL